MSRRPSNGPRAVTTEPTQPVPDCSAVEDLANLLSPSQAAARLQVTESHLERWRSTGNGPRYIRLSRKTIRYSRSDLDAFILAKVRSNTVH